MNYGYQKTVKRSFEDVDGALRNALMDVGFGIITEIDVQKTFKEKLDIDYIKYRILGACNPTLAKQALDRQPEVGMLLPCNVIFWENEDGTVTISAVDAEQQLKATDQEDLVQLGRDVDGLLRQAVDSIL